MSRPYWQFRINLLRILLKNNFIVYYFHILFTFFSFFDRIALKIVVWTSRLSNISFHGQWEIVWLHLIVFEIRIELLDLMFYRLEWLSLIQAIILMNVKFLFDDRWQRINMQILLNKLTKQLLFLLIFSFLLPIGRRILKNNSFGIGFQRFRIVKKGIKSGVLLWIEFICSHV